MLNKLRLSCIVDYGGLGLDFKYVAAVLEELGTIRCGGVPMAIAVQMSMTSQALSRFGSDELKKEFLAPSIAGDYVACVGISEPGKPLNHIRIMKIMYYFDNLITLSYPLLLDFVRSR